MMWRLLTIVLQATLFVGSIWFGAMAIDRTAIPGAGGMAIGLVAAAAGLMVGLAVAWLRGIPWHLVPVLIAHWRAGLSAQLTWLAVGCLSLAVLVYY